MTKICNLHTWPSNKHTRQRTLIKTVHSYIYIYKKTTHTLFLTLGRDKENEERWQKQVVLWSENSHVTKKQSFPQGTYWPTLSGKVIAHVKI